MKKHKTLYLQRKFNKSTARLFSSEETTIDESHGEKILDSSRSRSGDPTTKILKPFLHKDKSLKTYLYLGKKIKIYLGDL